MTVFNARTIEAAKPGVARIEISDPTLRALRLVVQPSGLKSWAVRYGLGGRKRKLTIGGYPVVGLADARERARAALQDVAKGIDPYAAKRNASAPDASTASAIDQFDAMYVATLRPGSQANLRRELIHARAAWGNRPLVSIRKVDVIALADIAAGRGPTSRSTMLKSLASFFGWCSNRAMIEHAPTSGLRRPRSQSRDRVLNDAELAAVWASGSPLARLLILTGCRRDEIAKLEWSEVTANAIKLPASRTKTAVAHTVALTPLMRSVLDALPRHPDRRFAINDSNSPKCVGGRDKPDVAIDDWRFHDLRRSFASGCARIGILPHVIEHCLNHAQGGVAAIYNRHTYETECAAAWSAWSAHVETLCHGLR